MNEKSSNREYLITEIAEIIERKGSSRNKATSIVDGILFPAVDEISEKYALTYRILERALNLPSE